MEPLPCSAIVYRAMARSKWIDNGQIMPAAFIRRPPPKDEDGLSVDIDSARSCASVLRDCYGVTSLHVGHVRGLQLDVVVDEAPHANITGVPRPSEDRDRAEWLASQLARQARTVPTDKWQSSQSS
jgi:hypothetical protein